MEPLNKTADLTGLRIDRDQTPGGRRLVWPIAATLLVVAVAGIIFWARRSGGVTIRAPEVTTTRIVLVTPTQASTVLTASGYIVARSKAEISPKSVGRIAWLNLEEGQRVKKGELVARLESQELEAQKRQFLATKEQVVAQLQNAKLDRDRAKALLESKIGTQQAFDSADAQVRSLTAQIVSIDEQVRYTEELIKNAEIYAPIDGVVTVKKAFLGETVAPQGFGGAGSAGATFAIIVDLGSLEMEADINEQNLGKLSLGQPAEVTLDAYPDRPYKARLRQIVPTADRQKGSVKVKVEILDRDTRVLPEMSCRVVFLDPNVKPAEGTPSKVMVPAASVVEVDGKKGALFVQSDRAVFHPLGLGPAAGSQVEVTSGASGGEEIVADAAGDRTWRRDQKIRVKKD
ncbi:MAG: efflux RND transporter periplasmic adaptor subunit [Thermoanaerobaculia bacterium]